jgi:cysteine desulfurase
MQHLRGYLDYNATTPIHPLVVDKMLPYLQQHFGNPSSSHQFGVIPKKAVTQAREQVAECIGATKLPSDIPYHVIFTSGGTESINLAFNSVLDFRSSSDKKHIIVSSVEHVAVFDSAYNLRDQFGVQVSQAPVDARGIVDLEQFEKLLTKDTVFVSVMLANNETGSVQPIKRIVELCKKFNPDIVVHSDASQCVGKIPVDVALLDVDMLTVAGHKIYSPKGIGALFIKHRKLSNDKLVNVKKLLHGAGSQEFNMRAGTENVPYIVGLGESCLLVSENVNQWMTDSRRHRDLLLKSIKDCFKEKYPADHEYRYRINSPIESEEEGKLSETLCLPNTLNIAFRDQTASNLLHSVGDKLAASPGA